MSEPIGPPAGSTRRRRVVMALLMAFIMLNISDKAVLGYTAAPIMKQFNLTATGFGAVAGGFYLLFSLSALLVGFLGNRFSVRPILVVLALVWAVAQLPVLLASTGVTVLALTRVVLGAGEGPSFPLANHTAFSWYPHRLRTLPGSALSAAGALGAFLGAPLLILVSDRLGWRAAFGVLGAAGLVWAAAWWFLGGTGPYDGATGTTGAAKPERAEADVPWIPYRRLLTSGTWLGATFNAFTVQWTLVLGLTFLPLYLEKSRGFADAKASMMIGVPSMLMIVLALALGAGSQRLVKRGSVRAHGLIGGGATLLAGLALLALTRVHGTGPLMVAMSLAFAAGNAQTPLMNAALASVSPARQRSAALGTSYAVAAIASIAAPVVSGRLLDSATVKSVGYGHAFDLAGGLLVAGGLVALLVVRSARQPAAAPVGDAAPAGQPVAVS